MVENYFSKEDESSSDEANPSKMMQTTENPMPEVKEDFATLLNLNHLKPRLSVAENMQDAFKKMGQQVHDIVEEIKEFRSNVSN